MRKIFSLFVAALVCVSTFATTYTVVGGSEAIFGAGKTWGNGLNEPANEMTLVGDVYQLVKENVELAAGTYDYKIVTDHAWTTTYPQDGNGSFSVDKSGKYNVTFVLDLAAAGEKYSATAELQEEAVVLPTIQINGSWDTNWEDPIDLTPADDKLTASAKKTFSSVTVYQFGVSVNGAWRSNGSATTITRTDNSVSPTGTDGNMNLTVDAAGEYTFTWTYATGTLEVTYPEKSGDEPELVTTYYLVGSDKGWSAVDANKFTANEGVDGEYKITTTLATGETLKVLGILGDAQIWYADGMNNEYTVDAAHAGEKTIYFRPAGNAEWGDEGTTARYIYIEKNAEIIDPIVVKDLKLVPGVWTTDNAVLGCWAWGEKAEGAWSVFAGEGDTLTAKINEKADSVIFVRFAAEAEPAWNDELIWNKTASLEIEECGLFFVNAWDNYSWCEAYVPVLANGYYLVGTMNSHQPSADYKLVRNENAGEGIEEYSISLNLEQNAQFKVAYYENDLAKTWYADGMGNDYNYVAETAAVVIYFRPAGNAEWGTEGTTGYYCYVANDAAAAISNTEAEAKAVKVLRNGMLLIEKGGKTYNVLGTIVR